MLVIKLYIAPALLLLALTCPLWQFSQSLPVTGKGPMADSCVFYARTLLQNITAALTRAELFRGIDCAKQNMEMNRETNTPVVCAPQESACSGIIKTDFNQESCVTNIGEDLNHYYKFLIAQPDPDSLLRPNLVLSLRELMENCFKWSLPTDLNKAVPVNPTSNYAERLSLCKVLRGFHVRTITINRAIDYMSSGEHTK